MNAFFSIDSITLIAIHGWGMDATSWSSVKPLLEGKLPFKAINLPGYLDEPELPIMDMENVVDWLAEQFEGKCHLLGWSMGGLVAQAFALKYPNRVASLSFVCSTPCFTQKKTWMHALVPEVLSNFTASLQNNPNTTLRRFIALQFMGESAAAEIQKQLRSSVSNQTTSLHTLSVGLSWLMNCDYREQLTRSAVKQHWMFGEFDHLVPVSVGQALTNEYNDMTVSYFDGCGHAPHMTQSIRFTEKLLDFISQHTSN